MSTADHFLGYPRESGASGTRNHVLVIATDAVLNRVVEGVAERAAGTVCIRHQVDFSGVQRRHVPALSNLLINPNVAEAIVIGFGDDYDPLEDLVVRAREAGCQVTPVSVVAAGGVPEALERAAVAAIRAQRRAADAVRQTVPVRELVLGTECGGSDAFSGLTANPAVGACADMVVERGGSVILAETTELLGAEHLLRANAIDDTVGRKVEESVLAWERFALQFGEDLRTDTLAPGNISGGLSSIEEKSLGCIRKGGSSKIVDIVGFGERSSLAGLWVMDTDGDDICELTALAAGGANVIAFTTGRGTPTASPIVPTVKISSNSKLARRMRSLIDLDAGGILGGEQDVEAVGRDLYRLVLEVASGRLTCAEERGQADFAFPPIEATA